LLKPLLLELRQNSGLMVVGGAEKTLLVCTAELGAEHGNRRALVDGAVA
jgi:hypothetical protein